MKRIFTLLICATLAVATFAALPAARLKSIEGKTVNTATLSNDGKPIIVSFFATWCKPCMRELKAIHEVYPDWQDETGVKVVLISIDSAQDAERVKPLVDGQGWEYEVLLDPNGEFKRLMQVQTVPHVFVLDGKGNIVYNHTGYTDGSEDDLYEVVKKYSK